MCNFTKPGELLRMRAILFRTVTHFRSWAIVCFLAVSANGQPAPPDAYLEGATLPYYGSADQWNRRFFYDHLSKERFRPSRVGQREMLDIVENRPMEAVRFCQQALAKDADDLESMFNLAVAWSVLGESEKAFDAMKRSVDAGLPVERYLAGPRELLQTLTDGAPFRRFANGRTRGLLHGPMLGCMTDSSVKIWVRTANEAEVRIRFGEAHDLRDASVSPAVTSRADRDFTAVAQIDGLRPNTTYFYEVVVDGQSTSEGESASFQTMPPIGRPAKFDIGFGGGAAYVPRNERMWTTLAGEGFAAFLFMGDNVYIDLPQEANGFHRYTYYRRQSRPEFRRFVARTPAYAIWDDHDAAVDDVFLGPFIDRPKWKRSMWDVFRNNWNNPAYGGGERRPGCWFTFSIGDVQFFLLDGRFYRTNPRAKNASMLGPHQKEWLMQELAKSRATFKVLASPVPWSFDTKGGSLDTWNGFRTERDEIFAFLANKNIGGVVLISADRHRSDARRIDRDHTYPLYEFESSKLTNIHSHEPVGETMFVYNEKCSFGKLRFDTTKRDAELTFEIVSIDGDSIHAITLRRSELTTNKETRRQAPVGPRR